MKVSGTITVQTGTEKDAIIKALESLPSEAKITGLKHAAAYYDQRDNFSTPASVTITFGWEI